MVCFNWLIVHFGVKWYVFLLILFIQYGEKLIQISCMAETARKDWEMLPSNVGRFETQRASSSSLPRTRTSQRSASERASQSRSRAWWVDPIYMLCVDTYYDLKSDLYTASKNSTTENILKLHRVANTQLSFVSGQVLFLRVNIHILDPGVTPWRCAEIFVEFLQEWARYLFSLCHKLWHSIWVQWISRSSLRV